MAVLSLCFCERAFSSCGKRGPLFIVVRGPLTIAASLVAEHRLQTRRLSNCGSWAQLFPRHVGSSQTRARTCVPCIGRQILNHCATREALSSFIRYHSKDHFLSYSYNSLIYHFPKHPCKFSSSNSNCISENRFVLYLQALHGWQDTDKTTQIHAM